MRIGIVGAGGIGAFHAERLQESPEGQISAVFDVDEDRRVSLAQQHKAQPCDSLESLLELSDVVYVCTPPAFHREAVELAAARGLPVFCEKPLATNLADAAAITAAASHVPNQVGLLLRDAPAFIALRELVRDPAAGRVLHIHAHTAVPPYPGTWRDDAALVGGGVLTDIAFHDLDFVEWMVGPIVSVAARTDSVRGVPGIEDLAALTLALPDGGTGVLTALYHQSHRSVRSMEVFTENSWFRLSGAHPNETVDVHRVGQDPQALRRDDLLPIARAAAPLLGNPDADFLEAIRDGRAPHPDFATALRTHVLIDAAYRSNGQVIAT